jgi:hypothetical protein
MPGLRRPTHILCFDYANTHAGVGNRLKTLTVHNSALIRNRKLFRHGCLRLYNADTRKRTRKYPIVYIICSLCQRFIVPQVCCLRLYPFPGAAHPLKDRIITLIHYYPERSS